MNGVWQRVASICTGRRAKGNRNVDYDAPARRILVFNMNEKLEDQLRGAIRLKHFSLKTEETYGGWYRRVDGALPRHPSG